MQLKLQSLVTSAYVKGPVMVKNRELSCLTMPRKVRDVPANEWLDWTGHSLRPLPTRSGYALADPGKHELRVNPRNVDQFVRIEDPESSIMELNNTILSQISQHTVDMDGGQARRISDIFLR